MSFQSAIENILNPKEVGGIVYRPYVTRRGKIPTPEDSLRSDYDEMRATGLHAGVDIIFGKVVDGKLAWIGSGDPQNQNVTVYSPVNGVVKEVRPAEGSVYILDGDGYLHVIRHMRSIPSGIYMKDAPVTAGKTPIGTMSSEGLTKNNRGQTTVSCGLIEKMEHKEVSYAAPTARYVARSSGSHYSAWQ